MQLIGKTRFAIFHEQTGGATSHAFAVEYRNKELCMFEYIKLRMFYVLGARLLFIGAFTTPRKRGKK